MRHRLSAYQRGLLAMQSEDSDGERCDDHGFKDPCPVCREEMIAERRQDAERER